MKKLWLLEVRAKNIKNNQSHQTKLTLKHDLNDEQPLILKSCLLCASSVGSMAILLSGSVVWAEEQLPILRASNNMPLELDTSLHSDLLHQNHTIATSDTDFDQVTLNDEVIPNKAPHHVLAQISPEISEKPVDSAQALTQDSSSSPETFVESADESTEPSPQDQLEQSDDLTPQPAEPSSDLAPPAESPSAQPDEPSSTSASSNSWQFSVEPYFFVPLSVQADVTAAGRSASINLGLDDVLNLDRAFDAGLRLEARHNRLGFILDAFYVSAAQSGTIGITFPEGSLQRFGINTEARIDGDASVAIDELTVDAAVSYRVIDTVLGKSAESSNPYPHLTVAPIVGLRTRFLWEELEVDNVRIGDISLPINREFDSSSTTIEPLIGAQIGLDLSKRWTINFRGDVSGFNINADQDFTWNLLVGTQYHISPSISLQLAYRFNGFDFEDGEGLSRTRLNLYQNGIWLSSIFRF